MNERLKENGDKIIGQAKTATGLAANSLIEYGLMSANPGGASKAFAGLGIAAGCYLIFDGVRQAALDYNIHRGGKIPDSKLASILAHVVGIGGSAMIIGGNAEAKPAAVVGALFTAGIVYEANRNFRRGITSGAEAFLKRVSKKK